MKKIIIFFLLLLTFGCSNNFYAKTTLESYLEHYKSLDIKVLENIDNDIEKENLTNSQKEKYKEILKRQYQDMEYIILKEEYNGNNAYILVELNVYNLAKVTKDTNNYLENNLQEFMDSNNKFNQEKYIDFQLDRMLITNEKIKYQATFTLIYTDKWQVDQPSDDTLKKIHGLYT